MKKPVGLLTTEQQLTAALARITELESNNRELTLLLDMTTSHSDVVTEDCLLYTSPSPRDGLLSRMPSSA